MIIIHSITKEDHEQIIQRATRELQLLDTEETENQTRLPSIDTQIATLNERQAARSALLSTTRATLATTQQMHSEASTRGKLTEGLLGHAQAMEDARLAAHVLTRIGNESASIEATAKDEQQHDQAALEALSSERLTRLERLHTIQQERIDLHHAKDIAHLAIGELEHTAVQAELAELDHQLEIARASTNALEQQKQEALSAGLARLQPWDHHVAAIRATLPPIEDDCTRTMQLYVDLCEAYMLNNGYHLMAIQNLRSVQGKYLNINALCSITQDDIYHAFALPSRKMTPYGLISRRDTMKFLLNEYINSKK